MNKDAEKLKGVPAGPLKRVLGWAAPLWILGFVIMIISVIWIEENWRGRYVWRQTRAELTVRNENLDWNHYLPKPPPDDSNMMMAPGMDAFIKGKRGQFSLAGFGPVPRSTNEIQFGEIESLPENANAPAGSIVFDLDELKDKPLAKETLWNALRGKSLSAPNGLRIARKISDEQKKVYLRAAKPPTLSDLQDILHEPSAVKEGLALVRQSASNVFSVSVNARGCVAADDYLKWADAQANFLTMLDNAFERPECWIPGDYSMPFFSPVPNFVRIRDTAQFLGARAQAYTLLGRPEEAYREIERIRQLRRITMSEPLTLVAAMINVAICGLETKVIENGFEAGIWQEKQLRGFIENYSKIQLIEQVAESLRGGERAGILQMIERLTGPEYERALALPANDPTRELVIRLHTMPNGWKRQNMAAYARLMQDQIDLIDSARSINPFRVQSDGDEIVTHVEGRSPMRLLTGMAVPNAIKASQTTARNQTLVNQVVIAAALELHRTKHSDYPENLAALSPEYFEKVPADFIFGQPMHYQKWGDGQYVLYSVGWDGNDDLGRALANSTTNAWKVFASKTAESDWVWRGVPEPSRKIKSTASK